MTGSVTTLEQVLVTPAWLLEHREDDQVRVLDVRAAETFAEGHIQHALSAELNTLRHTRDGVEGMLLPPDAFATAMGRLGIDADTLVVAYDDFLGVAAARLVWSLLHYGHGRVALLDGGWEAWQVLDYPSAEGAAPSPAPRQFISRPQPENLAEYEWIQQHLGEVVLLDVRTPGEYAAGHLPGAVHWDWINGADVVGGGVFRPAAEVLPELAALGVAPDKPVVTYCQSGVRAAHTYLLLRRLGFTQVRNYDGSWVEWSAKYAGTN